MDGTVTCHSNAITNDNVKSGHLYVFSTLCVSVRVCVCVLVEGLKLSIHDVFWYS